MTLIHSILVNWLKTHYYLFSYGALVRELSGDVCIEEGMSVWHIKTSTGIGGTITRDSKTIKWAIKSRQYNMQRKAK